MNGFINLNMEKLMWMVYRKQGSDQCWSELNRQLLTRGRCSNTLCTWIRDLSQNFGQQTSQQVKGQNLKKLPVSQESTLLNEYHNRYFIIYRIYVNT